MIKHAQTNYPLHPMIKNRWSARSFSTQAITTDELNTILEAASWAPSAMNEQPWRYVAALKQHTEWFKKTLSIINPSNAAWVKDAAAIIFCYAKASYALSGNANVNALHDTGMANQNMLLQAMSMNIYGHVMEGFSKDKAKELFQLTEGDQPVCMIALGYLGNPDDLEEPYRTREITERSRKKLKEFVRYE